MWNHLFLFTVTLLCVLHIRFETVFAETEPTYSRNYWDLPLENITRLEQLRSNAMLRKPFRFHSSNVSSWNALQWNFLEWAEKWPVLYDVLEFPRTNKMEQGGFTVDSYEVLPELGFWDFLNDTLSFDGCRFYSTNFRVVETLGGLENETDWRSLQVIEDLGKHFDKSIYNIAPLFNLLYPDCSLQARYSEYHTMIVQLNGSATYNLIPPHKEYLLRPYPYHHPFSARHAQVDLFESELDWQKLRVQSAVLSPGQVLYVPPGYMLHTESSSVHNISMSLEILSPSKEQILLLETLMLPLPFSLVNKTMEEKIISTQVFFVHVLSRIHGMKSILKFAEHVYDSRYELLFPRNSMAMLSDPFDCYNSQLDVHERIVDSLPKEKFVDAAEAIANRFNDQSLPKELKWTWVENFADGTLRTVLGEDSLRQSALFYRECLNFDGKLEVIEEVPGPSSIKLDPKY